MGIPEEKTSPMRAYLQGFVALRLLLQKPTKNSHDEELLSSILTLFSAHTQAGRSEGDVAWMTCRDFMVLTRNELPLLQTPAVPTQISTAVAARTVNNDCGALDSNGGPISAGCG